MLAACTKYVFVYSVGEADNPIRLMAGMSDGSADARTKADPDPDSGANYPHSEHLAIAEGVKLALRIDGKWYKTDGDDATDVSQTTVATVGTETVTDPHSMHSSIEMSPVRYWDDYGTADPHNAGSGRGRERGLDIYGVGVNDATVAAPEVSSWTAFPWELPLDQSGVGSSEPWSKKDLITSQNVKASASKAYKFEQRASGKLLEFTHAMSKIVIKLTPGSSFSSQFSDTPGVEFMTAFKMSGNVNVETGVVTPTGAAATIGSQKFRVTAPTEPSKIFTYDALIMPGNRVRPAGDNVDFLKITTGGNNYIVSTQKLAEKMAATQSGSLDYKSGKEYVVNITLDRTGINVTATIVDWQTVTADPVNPQINISANVGQGTASVLDADRQFSFFIREDETATDLYGTVAGENPNQYYTEDDELLFKKREDEVVVNKWGLVNGLYWPDHHTHLHMRAVFPKVGTADEAASKPVVKGTTPADQYIAVRNAAYAAGTYPSDLLLGKPIVSDGAQCPNYAEHQKLMAVHGICATSGTINLTLNYKMCQVEVRLKSESTDPNAVVDLTKAEVSILDVLNSGMVYMDGLNVVTDGLRASYVLDPVLSGDARGGIPVANIRHSAIVPQSLVYGNTNQYKLRLKIQLKKESSTGVYDVNAAAYYVEDLPNLMHESTPITPNKAWESGKHYIYTLNIVKTHIDVSARIVDWIDANAESDVWM